MKKLSVIILAAMAMISCGNTYTAQQAQLATLNDSINFALGVLNGTQFKTYYLRNDSTPETVAEFIDALQAGYDGSVPELSETARIGMSIGASISQNEKNGLADNPAWTLNEKLFFQGLVNGLNQDTTVMDPVEARQFFQEQYSASHTSTEKAGKAVTGTCPSKVKTVTLKTLNDSLNYAFGLFNGSEMAMYVLADDTLGEKKAELIKHINKGLKERLRNPQLKHIGEQVGKSIKEQEGDGLIGEPTLATDFALIKQGFINSMLGDESQMTGAQAGEYIQATLNHIKYGDTKEQGEKFLEENKLREGVITTESGLQYEVLKMGKGARPTATDKVKVHYHGTLIDGKVFDSSVERGEPITFPLNGVIAGWTEGVQLMPVGSKFKFFIPYYLAYGERAMGEDIPPYSALIFEVELLGIEK